MNLGIHHPEARVGHDLHNGDVARPSGAMDSSQEARELMVAEGLGSGPHLLHPSHLIGAVALHPPLAPGPAVEHRQAGELPVDRGGLVPALLQ
jgi:hypothetical protein